MLDLKAHIRNVQDFPKPGIGFKDITTLLKNGQALSRAVDLLGDRFDKVRVDKIVGIESRGFIFGAALAYHWSTGFVPVRKPGKLPADTIDEQYELEYGTDHLEIHTDAIAKGESVLIIDDLLATGGTALATVKLIEKLGGKVAGLAFLIELSFLAGRKKLENYEVISLIKYESE